MAGIADLNAKRRIAGVYNASKFDYLVERI